jgi:hypothetical protein
VVEPLESLGFLLTLATAGTEEFVTSVKEVVLNEPTPPGKTGTFSVSFPNNRFRPGELAMTACLGSWDFSAFDDILDSNVNLPHLSIESGEEDFHLRLGSFSAEYIFAHDRG